MMWIAESTCLHNMAIRLFDLIYIRKVCVFEFVVPYPYA